MTWVHCICMSCVQNANCLREFTLLAFPCLHFTITGPLQDLQQYKEYLIITSGTLAIMWPQLLYEYAFIYTCYYYYRKRYLYKYFTRYFYVQTIFNYLFSMVQNYNIKTSKYCYTYLYKNKTCIVSNILPPFLLFIQSLNVQKWQ